jgi:hypothetical protein
MFNHVEPLNKDKHQDLKLNPARDYSFAKGLSIVPLSYSEFFQASRSYPIIFPKESTTPQALLSLTQGQNSFLDRKSQWTVPYVPAHIRRYPFILARSDDQDNYAVCIDPDAPQFSTDFGDPLYTANLEPSETLNKTIEFLKRYHQEMVDTEKLFGQLDEQGILVDRQFNLGSGDQKRTVGGFRAVDETKLKELDAETLGKWVKQGIMGLVYAHLFSLDNVRQLAG